MRLRKKRQLREAFPVIVLLLFLLVGWGLIMSPELTRSGVEKMVSWGAKTASPLDQVQ